MVGILHILFKFYFILLCHSPSTHNLNLFFELYIVTFFKCKGCNKLGFTSEHSLAGHHQHRKQCKILHYSIILTNDQISKLISPTAQSLTPLITSSPTSTDSNINQTNNNDIKNKTNCSDMEFEAPFTFNDDSD